MQKLLKKIITITILLTNLTLSFGQRLNGLSYNHAIINAIQSGNKSIDKAAIEPIDFDSIFFDDFSDYHYAVFPKKEHWADRYAYINSTYPDSMISLGVATLDAFDQYGYPYYTVENPIAASDTLTSQPFNFKETPDKDVYFSFFYQAGGKGDLPEGIANDDPDIMAKDTLILEFFSVDSSRWDPAFSTLDNTDSCNFRQVILKVDNSYLKDGFKFRFRNYTSMTGNYQQGEDMGKFSNADQWHIDYIVMKEVNGPSDLETLRDITIVKPLLPSLTGYTTVPWSHLNTVQMALESIEMPITIRNFDPNNGASFNVVRFFKTIDLTHNEYLLNRDFSNLFDPYRQITFRDTLISNIFYNDDDTIGRFERIGFIQPDIGIVQPYINDTVKRMEIYYDQYAYDDGSAEFGFGIGGDNEDNIRVAQRFRTYHKNSGPDSLLRGVLIYFGKSVDSSTIDYAYSISIRAADQNKPSAEVLYSSGEYTPDYSVKMNEFTRIEIDPPLPVPEDFFVVVNQISGYLNIGYDINNDNLDKIYVYSNQTWTQPYSLQKGSLMIRPSFGKYSLPTRLPLPASENSKLEVYPNPATDMLYFKSDPQTKKYDIKVYNIMGVMLLNTETDLPSIEVSSLNPGIYLLVVTSSDNTGKKIAKFIKE